LGDSLGVHTQAGGPVQGARPGCKYAVAHGTPDPPYTPVHAKCRFAALRAPTRASSPSLIGGAHRGVRYRGVDEPQGAMPPRLAVPAKVFRPS